MAILGVLTPAATGVAAGWFVIPTAIRSEPTWANPSGIDQPFSYNCPPNIGVPPPPVDPPSSWVSFLATSLVGQDFVDAVTQVGNDAIDSSYTAYKAAHGGQDPPGFSSLDAIEGAAKSRITGSLTSTSFWSGVIQRLGDYGMPHGVDPEQFLGYAASYYGLASSCDQSAAAETWLYATPANDFFLQQGSSWARVVVHGGTLSSGFGFEPIRGTPTPSWLVLSGANPFGLRSVIGRLDIGPGVATDPCGFTAAPSTDIRNSIALTARTVYQDVAPWASIVLGPLPALLPPCPSVDAFYSSIVGPTDVDPLSLQTSFDARFIAGWTSFNNQPTLVRWKLAVTSDGTFTYGDPLPVAAGYLRDSGFDGSMHVAMSGDGQTITACRAAPLSAPGAFGGASDFLRQGGTPGAPLVIDVLSGKIGWPDDGLTSGLDCGNVTITDDGSRMFWVQRGPTPGWYSGSTVLSAAPATLSSIAVTPSNPTVAKGAASQFIATGTYSDGSSADITTSVTWASSATSVATVTSGGLATAMAATGTSTVSAASSAVSGATVLTAAPATLSAIAVTPSNPTVAKGAARQFSATGTYSDGSSADITTSVTWASSATAVATITSGGLVTAVAASGTSTLSATQGSVAASTVLTAAPATLVSLEVTPKNPTVAKGATRQFSATGTYSDGSSADITTSVTWASSATAVATITSGGLVTAVAASGTSTLSATQGSVAASTVLTASPATLDSITLAPATPAIPNGSTQQFIATGTYSDGSIANLTSTATWTSSNAAVATITSGGLVTATTQGATVVSARSGSSAGSTTLTVGPPTVGSISQLIDSYLPAGAPGNAGVANALKTKLTGGSISAFVNQVNAQCCSPSPGKRLSRQQADMLVTLARQL